MFDNTQPSAAAAEAEDHATESTETRAESSAASDSPADSQDGGQPVEPACARTTPDAPAVEPAAAAAAPAEPDLHENPERHPTAEEVEAATAAEEAASAEAMDKLLEQYAAPAPLQQEEKLIEGRVVAIQDGGVVVDLGGKFEGLIPAQEFADASSELRLLPGERVEVFLLDEEKDGYKLLSYLRALRKRIWENIEKSFREKMGLSGKVVDRIKGGLVVDIGIPAFMPASQTDVHPLRDVEPWLNQEITVRVIKMNRKRGNVVVSRRALLEEEVAEKRAKLLETLAEGAIVKGVVKNMTDYGAFVDLGGLDGLLHVTDISWSRVAKPADALTAGQEVEVVVLRFDKEKHRISLGMKQLKPDPWGGLLERFPTGSQHRGRISGVTDYGCFVELEAGVEGLVHVSEMTWSKRPKHPAKMVSLNDTVDVKVLEIKPESRRISLSIKQTSEDPWHAFAAKYPQGSVVKGTVRNLTDFGAFLEIEEGFDGLIHVSDISWTERVKNPADKFKKGDEVEAKVLKIDSENRRLSLGVKQLNDIWAQWFAQHKVDEVVRGKVVRAAEFGVFVELAEGIEGLCHKTEIESRRDREEREKGKARGPGVTLEVGQEYDFKIVKISRDQHKIGLSYRAAARAAERKEMMEYRSTSKSSSKFTIGDMILSKRNSQ
jgi:small subunit ribosomal protein S1